MAIRPGPDQSKLARIDRKMKWHVENVSMRSKAAAVKFKITLFGIFKFRK